jgi:hypothetical protein
VHARISADHPIRDLFQGLVVRTFHHQMGLADQELCRYVGNVLVEFVHRDNVYRIRDTRGMPLEEVAEMMLEGDVSLNATSFDREREVHKHIGDFTLFWTGVYPEMLRYLRSSTRRDHLIDYVQQGRKSYHIASTFQYGDYADEAPVLRQLADQFETCMVGLHLVRRELDACGTPEMQTVRRLLEDA